ncbi:MAG TPA: hypothetical protein DD727_00185, partial [Clostridiales bacterium]|nr:hypothetical protein [Clostridiales bacterium]
RKKLGRPSHEGLPAINPTHYQILITLKNEGMLSVSDIGRRLMISKPNMTPLIDKLLSFGFVNRVPDVKDRRIVNISLTDEGRSYLDERRRRNQHFLGEKLARLPEGELDELVGSIDVLFGVLQKLE